MTAWLWGVLALLVLVAGGAARGRLRPTRRDAPPPLDDDALRRIERTGRLETGEDEPLDQAEIDEAERRFWEESWDEPEEM